MKRTFVVLAAVAALGAGCAGANTAGANKANVQNMHCNPCPMPCTLGCMPAVAKAAPAPVPPPPAPAPEPAAAATFDPPPGEYPGAQAVTITSTTPGAVVHCTSDGTPPTADSPVCSGPIAVEKTTTLRAIAIAPGAPASPVSTGAYTIAPPPPPPPKRVEVTKERLQLKETVLFDSGKSTIDQRSYGLLDEVAAALKDHPEVKQVRVEGHTDNRGDAKKNLKLSQARAEAVRKYLVDRGVAADRLTAKGFGQKRPVASNKTAAGRETNRRVDFIIPQ